MADKTLKTIIQVRRDTTANWETHKTYVPKAGEPCLDTDTGLVKWGDGSTDYEHLKTSGAGTAEHYEGERQESEDDNTCIERVLAGTEPRLWTATITPGTYILRKTL